MGESQRSWTATTTLSWQRESQQNGTTVARSSWQQSRPQSGGGQAHVFLIRGHGPPGCCHLDLYAIAEIIVFFHTHSSHPRVQSHGALPSGSGRLLAWGEFGYELIKLTLSSWISCFLYLIMPLEILLFPTSFGVDIYCCLSSRFQDGHIIFLLIILMSMASIYWLPTYMPLSVSQGRDTLLLSIIPRTDLQVRD